MRRETFPVTRCGARPSAPVKPHTPMPYTGVVLTILAFHAAAFLILLGHWLVGAGMFPKATQTFSEVYERRPIRATLLGLVTYGPLLVLLLNSGKLGNGAVKLLAIVAGFTALLLAFIGSAGLALRIGRNLSGETSPWHQVLRGGVMLALVFITPVLGSLFLLHIGLASGFGAVLLSRPWKAKAPAPAALAETPEPALS